MPYCSSDAWLGDADGGAWAFHGARIVAAVFADLFATKQLGAADAVVIVGGAGVMLQVPALLPLFAPAQRVYAVCDGCLLFDVFGAGTQHGAGSAAGTDAASTTAPPSSTLLAELARGWAPDAWNASVSALAKCAFGAPPAHSFECALAPSVIAALHTSTNDLGAAGVLFAQTLIDRVQLAAVGAWPPLPSNAPARSAFAATAVAALRKIGDARAEVPLMFLTPSKTHDKSKSCISDIVLCFPNEKFCKNVLLNVLSFYSFCALSQWARAPFILGAACFAPTACALSAQCTFATQVGAAPCNSGDGNGHGICAETAGRPQSASSSVSSPSSTATPVPPTKAALIVALAEMIRDRARAPNDAIEIVDKTFFVGANPTCAVPPPPSSQF